VESLLCVPGTHRDLESAVKAATEGTTILLTPGKTYKIASTLDIKKSFSIIADGASEHAVIKFSGVGPAVEYSSREQSKGQLSGLHVIREAPKGGPDGDVWLGAVVVSQGRVAMER